MAADLFGGAKTAVASPTHAKLRKANELSRYLAGTYWPPASNPQLAGQGSSHIPQFSMALGKGQVGWSSRNPGEYRANVPGVGSGIVFFENCLTPAGR